MEIHYAVSTWNFNHYAARPSLADIAAWLRRENLGIELWDREEEGRRLFSPEAREALAAAVAGLPVSLHTNGPRDAAGRENLIACAAALGARVIVLHAADLRREPDGPFDAALARDMVAAAAAAGVRLALENGPLPLLVEALARTDGLGACLDVGHVYFGPEPMSAYLAELGPRLIHLHFQDILPPGEQDLPFTGKDHYLCGTGGIPRADWELLAATLRKNSFRGAAVFEIRPRNPFQTAVLGRRFATELLGG